MTSCLANVNDGYVSYLGFQGEPFQDFIQQLAFADIAQFDEQQQLAFYINAYNAFAIDGILQGRSPRNFWQKVRFFYLADIFVAGKKTNLYDFEHKIIRPLGEPRIHFALVCAAYSCPKLRSEAYRAEQLQQQLEESARQFINDSKRNRFDAVAKTAYLSAIFKWFKKDFLATGKTLQEYIADYVEDPNIAKDLAANRYTIEFLPYNWQLNGHR